MRPIPFYDVPTRACSNHSIVNIISKHKHMQDHIEFQYFKVVITCENSFLEALTTTKKQTIPLKQAPCPHG